MLKTEFTELTGFCPTDDYYHEVIEREYEQSDINKQDWCKQWKKQGGIQRAYDAMCALREVDNLKASKIEEANIILRKEDSIWSQISRNLRKRTRNFMLTDRKE